MNILMVSPYFYPEGGGLERYVYSVSRLLVEEGHRVVVVCAGRERLGEEEMGGIRVVRVRPWWRVSNTPVAPALYTRALEAVKSCEIDLIHAHTPVPFAVEMAVLVAEKNRVPFVVTYYSSGVHAPSLCLKLAWKFYEPVEKWSLRHACRITTLSRHASEYLAEKHHASSTVIPPGVWGTQEHHEYTPQVLFVGQLDRAHQWKGLEILMRAVAQLSEVEGLKLVVVGEGDYREHYQRLAEECGIGGIVEFRGRLGDDALMEEYRRAGVLVLPSTSGAESFGMVLIEAMSCATPVIGSSIGGVQEVIRPGVTGILVPPGDVSSLSEALRQVLSDKKLMQRLGEEGRREVKDKYLWNNTAKKLLKVYRDVMYG